MEFTTGYVISGSKPSTGGQFSVEFMPRPEEFGEPLTPEELADIVISAIKAALGDEIEYHAYRYYNGQVAYTGAPSAAN